MCRSHFTSVLFCLVVVLDAIAQSPAHATTTRIIGGASQPQALVVTDLNEDGVPDIAVVDQSGQAQVIVRYADGSAASTGFYNLGVPLLSIATGDFNEDGHSDLAITSASGKLFVLNGNGDGTFGPAREVNAGSFTNSALTAVITGDFNGDGRLDLAVSDAAGTIRVLTGMGDGTFSAGSPVHMRNGATKLVSADLDGDGHADLAIAAANGVSVLPGKGDGTFRAPVLVLASGTVEDLAILDLGVRQPKGVVSIESSGRLSIVFWKSDGFRAVARYTGAVGALATGDFDGDGHSDVAVSNALENAVQFYAARGDGTLEKPVAFDAGMPVSGLAMPVNGSRVMGLLSAKAGAIAEMTLPMERNGSPISAVKASGADALQVRSTGQRLSPASQTVTSTALSASPNPSIYGHSVMLTATVTPFLATGSITFYDGTYILGRANLSAGAANFSTVLLNAGNRKLTARYNGDANYLPSVSSMFSQRVNDTLGTGYQNFLPFIAGAQPGWVAVGDFNRDGKQDVAVINTGGNNASIFLGNGDGTFGAPKTYTTGVSPLAAAVSDFNGDGFQDLAITSGNGVGILLGNGDGTFRTLTDWPADASPAGLAVGDFNRDGIPDLAVANGGNSNVSILLGNGSGGFQGTTQITTGNPSGTGTVAVAVGDFNGDGNPDVAAINSTDGILYLFFGNGNGTFQTAVADNLGGSPADIAAADLNGDGILDLIVPQFNTDTAISQMLVLIGIGNGTFQTPVTYPTGNVPSSVAAGDFNGDAIPDIAIANSVDSNVSIFIGNGNGTFQAASVYPPVISNPGGYIVQVTTGEFNGDGVTDLAVADAGGLFSGSTNPGELGILLAGSCNFSPSPSSLALDNKGEITSLTLFTAGGSCPWTASSDSSWITLSRTSGTGTAAIGVTVAPNSTGIERVGNITIGGQVVQVVEWGTAQTFSDVPPTAYYFDAANLLFGKSITAGCGNNNYCPSGTVTRDQMAIFVVRTVLNGNDNFMYSPTPHFGDVPISAFGFKWIQKLYELGITAGCGGGNYCPGFAVNRDQMSIFIIRARFGAVTNFDYPPTPYFTDVPASDPNFKWVQRLKMDAITAGCSPVTYCPTLSISRGDMAIFLIRGGFNQLLPVNTPVIASISPATISPGQSGTFTITGVNTHFAQGVTLIDTTAGVFTVNSISVASPTSLQAQITVSGSAPLQPASIFVKTGFEEAVLPNGLLLQ